MNQKLAGGSAIIFADMLEIEMINEGIAEWMHGYKQIFIY
jgi:hypothetical protein